MFKGLGNALVGVVNSGLSLIKDKTRDPETSMIHEKVKNGISISSKRVLNIGGTSAIVVIALTLIKANGLTWMNLALLALGAAYSIFMTWLTQKAESKPKPPPNAF